MTLTSVCAGETPTIFGEQEDYVEGIPEGFSRFYFEGHPEKAAVLSHFLWYHFSHRMGANMALFNKEYLTVSDMWVGGARRDDWNASAQEQLRKDLLAIELDEEGYVHTYQHFSHSHEQGWPFPMWVQSHGTTMGWHFQREGYGWAWDFGLNNWPDSPYGREKALEGWELQNVVSEGIVDQKWRLEATGPDPAIVSPEYTKIDAFNSPFLQLRWTRSKESVSPPYIEWMREEDTEFSADRRVYIAPDTGNPSYEAITGATHSLVRMHRHPNWNGTITRLRVALAPGDSEGRFGIDSLFAVYDTRHPINNPIYILSCWNYFRWTGDLPFLRQVLNKMRMALQYQQRAMGGEQYNHIRNTWPGHDGLPGYTVHPDGSKTMQPGHGIGNNYYDLIPFGWDDFYSTYQYYASLQTMAAVEQAILDYPEWSMPLGALASDPAYLTEHAADVKRTANKKFWNPKTKRFYASIDKEGNKYDYGFTFVNLDAIWYDIATEKHAQDIMAWLNGDRVVKGDTSTGEDIYHWRFGPRATTLRNIEWYGFGWTAPETIPWGGQIQDGGAVLGFAFYDVYARHKVLGPDNAWQRLSEMLEWETEVQEAGGYRPYYADGKRGTTLQGGGTAGGIGVDFEFFESSLVPAAVLSTFLGIDPAADRLVVRPELPEDCPVMGVSNLLYCGVTMDIKAGKDDLTIVLKDASLRPIRIDLGPGWVCEDTPGAGPVHELAEPGLYRFTR